MSVKSMMQEIGRAAVAARRELAAGVRTAAKNRALSVAAATVRARAADILAANEPTWRPRRHAVSGRHCSIG